MKSSKGKAEIKKDKVMGEIKEVVGKVTGNQQLELDGKLQSLKSDLKGKTNIKDKVDDIKESIAEKINDAMDKGKKK